MDMATYLEQTGLTQKAFGRLVGVSQGMVWQWLTGRLRVTAVRAVAIERATAGAVLRHELRPDLFDPPATAETEATA